MRHPHLGQRVSLLLGVLGLLPVLGMAEEKLPSDRGTGLRDVASGEGFTPSPSAVRTGDKGKDGGDRNQKAVPGSVGNPGASAGGPVGSWKDSSGGQSPLVVVPERGRDRGSQDVGRYWDPPPGFSGDSLGQKEEPPGSKDPKEDKNLRDSWKGSGDRKGLNSSKGTPDGERFPDRRFRDGNSGSWRDAVGRENGQEGSRPPTGFSDEAIDPQQEIDPYYLRKKRENGYPGSPPSWGWESGPRGDNRSGRYGRDGDPRWGQDEDSRYGTRSDGSSRSRDGDRYRDENRSRGGDGSWGEGRYPSNREPYDYSPSGSKGYYRDRRNDDRYEGPLRSRGEESGSRVDPRGDGSYSAPNGAGGSFSWNSRYDWRDRNNQGWGMPVPGWGSPSMDWMRPWNGSRGGERGYGPGYDSYPAPDDLYMNEWDSRGPWR